MKPLVSIIIPVYNGSDFIEQAIKSAINQTYDNIEILVVNDGSCDNGKTEEIVLKFGNKVKYFSKANGGVSSALNFGIKQMKGEYFSWLSHDDEYYPQKIAYQIDMVNAENDKNLLVFSRSDLIDVQGDIIGKPFSHFANGIYSGYDMYKKFARNASINGCTLLIPKHAIEKAGYFDESLKYVQDLEMWIFVALDGFRFLSTSKKLVRMRVHGNQQSVKLKDKLDTELESMITNIMTKLTSSVKCIDLRMRRKYFLLTINYTINIRNYSLFKQVLVKTRASEGMSLLLYVYLHTRYFVLFIPNFSMKVMRKLLFGLRQRKAV